MNIHVYFFASHRDIVGAESIDLLAPEGSTVAGVAAILAEKFPRLQPLLSIARAAVNEEYCPLDSPLNAGDCVAFIPPVSGG